MLKNNSCHKCVNAEEHMVPAHFPPFISHANKKFGGLVLIHFNVLIQHMWLWFCATVTQAHGTWQEKREVLISFSLVLKNLEQLDQHNNERKSEWKPLEPQSEWS